MLLKYLNETVFKKYFGSFSIMLIIFCFLFLSSSQLIAQNKNENVILKAMTDELSRSVTKLKMDTLQKPYYIDYTIVDEEILNIKASFGGIKVSNHIHSRNLKTNVRVGDYKLDNTNFIPISSLMDGSFYRGTGFIAIEDNYDAIRRSIWLSTDETYKSALENFDKKLAYIKNLSQTDQFDSYSKIDKPITTTYPDIKINWNDDGWKKSCVDFSNVFKKFPKVNKSEVVFSITLDKKYYVSSEGTRIIKPEALVSLEIFASTQASDGMKLSNSISFCAKQPEQLASKEEIIKKIEKMATELSELSEAPIVENYAGPVIFEGQAAAEFFKQLLAKNLRANPTNMIDDQRYASYIGGKESELKGKINMKILPEFFDVYADPGQNEFEGKPLAGSYTVDDEGVPGKKTQLINKGTLKSFFMSRTPVKDFNGSNGHGRGTGYDKIDAKASNLFVNVSEGKSPEELKKQLIDICKQQNKQYGLIIRVMSTGKPDPTQGTVIYSGDDSKKSLLSQPLVICQVFPDGTEKLVRGIDFTNITVRILKDIIAASNTYFVYNYIPGDEGMMGSRSYYGTPPVLGTSIVAPSIMIEEIETKKLSEVQQKPPSFKHPYFK